MKIKHVQLLKSDIKTDKIFSTDNFVEVTY